MKRGRPNIRYTVQNNLLQVLADSKTPMTVSSLTRFVSQHLSRHVSWNTTQKYLNELIQTDKVQPIMLPHSKSDEKNGLTVYTLKK